MPYLLAGRVRRGNLQILFIATAFEVCSRRNLRGKIPNIRRTVNLTPVGDWHAGLTQERCANSCASDGDRIYDCLQHQ